MCRSAGQVLAVAVVVGTPVAIAGTLRTRSEMAVAGQQSSPDPHTLGNANQSAYRGCKCLAGSEMAVAPAGTRAEVVAATGPAAATERAAAAEAAVDNTAAR